MLEKLDVEEILRKNPHIDEAKLKEGLELSEQLRALGLRKKEYGLASPSDKHRVRTGDPWPS